MSSKDYYKGFDLFATRSLSIIISVLIILFLGFRDPYAPSSLLGDTGQYSRMFEKVNFDGLLESKDIGFSFYMLIIKSIGGVTLFHLLNSTFYILPLFFAFRCYNWNYGLCLLISFIVSMSFFPYGFNGIRNGIATSVFILALFINNNLVKFFLFFICIFLHKSLLLPVSAFFAVNFYSNSKFYLRLWFLCLLLALVLGNKIGSYIGTLDITGDGRLSSASFAGEFDGNKFRTGLRLDFILYSFVPIFVGWFVLLKKRFRDSLYIEIFNIYLLSNSFWLLLNRIAFSNRYAYLSWFLYPILLVYPFLKERFFSNQRVLIAYIILYQFIFTYILWLK